MRVFMVQKELGTDVKTEEYNCLPLLLEYQVLTNLSFWDDPYGWFVKKKEYNPKG